MTEPAGQRDVWLPVTVRVAWEFLQLGVRTTPAHRADAREHVLRMLPAGVEPATAERLAPALTRDWLERVRTGTVWRPTLDEGPGVAIPPEWRSALLDAIDSTGHLLMREHYGLRAGLDEVEGRARIARSVLVAAREGLRETVRAIADEVGGPDWSDLQVDAVLRAITEMPAPGCPGPMGLDSSAGDAHARGCPRCGRAQRLLRVDMLTVHELFPPRGPLVSEGEVEVLAIDVHPDGRKHMKALKAAFGPQAVAVGGDTLLVPSEALAESWPAVQALCAAARPARHHLRAALARGPGRWSGVVLLGPLALHAVEAARARPWGEALGLPELPLPLPPPPSAAPWLAASGAAVLLTFLGARAILAPREVGPETPVDARFTSTAGGIEARFDAPDPSVVEVVALKDGALVPVRTGLRAAKGMLATGEGDYTIRAAADGLLVVASPDGLPALSAWIAQAGGGPDGLARLAAQVAQAEPRADIALGLREITPSRL